MTLEYATWNINKGTLITTNKQIVAYADNVIGAIKRRDRIVNFI